MVDIIKTPESFGWCSIVISMDEHSLLYFSSLNGWCRWTLDGQDAQNTTLQPPTHYIQIKFHFIIFSDTFFLSFFLFCPLAMLASFVGIFFLGFIVTLWIWAIHSSNWLGSTIVILFSGIRAIRAETTKRICLTAVLKEKQYRNRNHMKTIQSVCI